MPQATNRALGRARLATQSLSTRRWASPADAASAFGLMQGQDVASALLSLELRGGQLTDADWAELVRGYPMRNTLFVGTRADMGWMTDLCARPFKEHVGQFRDVLEEIPESGFSRAEFKALATRLHPELPQYRVLRTLMEENLVYYTGREQLVTRLRLPGLAEVFGETEAARRAAVTELATRYFRTHAPATLDDFAWWSKLPKRTIAAAARDLPDDLEVRDGQVIALDAPAPTPRTAFLLGGFDEYILGYQDRLFAMDVQTHEVLVPGNRGVLRRPVVVDGQVRGMWTKAGIEDRGIPAYAQPKLRRAFKAL